MMSHDDDHKWMQTCCFAEELHKALQYETIHSDKAVCTLKCFSNASRVFISPHTPVSRPYHTRGIQSLEHFTEQNANCLREEIEELCAPVLGGVLIGVKVKSTHPRGPPLARNHGT